MSKYQVWHLALQKYMAAAYQDKAKTKINTWIDIMPVKLKCPKLDCVWVTDQESEDSLAMNHLVMHVQAEHHIKVKPMEKSAVKQLSKMDKSVAPTIKAERVDKASARGRLR